VVIGRAPDLPPGFKGEQWFYMSGFHALQLALAFWWFGDYSLYPLARLLAAQPPDNDGHLADAGGVPTA
jgi:hypothetical protein